MIAAPSARPFRFAVAALLLTAATAGAQSERCGATDPEIGWLRFRGNVSFDGDELGNAIVTTPSSWARRAFRFIGTRRCLDADEFARDRVRLEIFYRKHGYRQATVDTLLRALRPGVVGVAFTIHEGLPVVIDSLTVDGYNAVRDARADTSHLPIRPRLPGHRVARNNVFDQYVIDATRDLLVRRLQASGYPFAQVLINSDVNTAKRAAWVGFTAVPGPYARIRSVNIDSRSARGSKAAIPDAVARHLSGLEPGAAYSVTDLQRAQRNLFETGGYRRVSYEISPDSLPHDPTQSGPDTALVDITLRMQEDYMHNARVGAGWGTLDCFRVQGQYTDRNFLNGARDFELSARVSKIGIADPFSGLSKSFCAPARGDIYADSLNYNVSATFRQAELFGARLYPQLSIYSERRSEYDAYVRSTPIGATASLTRNLGWLVTVAPQYTLQYGRTSASPALLCALFNLCQESDQLRVQREGVLSQLGLTVTRDGRDDPVLPHHGTFVSASITHSGPELGSLSEFQFTKITGEARWYSEIGHTGAVLGLRILGGRIFGTGSASNGISFVPLDQRLYAGGPTTVRGFPQNQLGPAVYLTQFVDSTCHATDTIHCSNPRYSHIKASRPVFVVPTGGNTSIVGNAELRLRSPVLPQYVGWTLFVDAGRVTPPPTGAAKLDSTFQHLFWTPGIGVQAFTPIGPVRLDVGYNPTQRPFGPAYYAVPPSSISRTSHQAQAPVLCVSPGNTGLIATDTTGVPVQTFPPKTGCPASYQPALQHGFFNHLSLNFSIGEAF